MSSLIELWRTSTFRLVVIYFGLFAISVAALLCLIWWQTVTYADQQAGETIDAEITGLAEQYRQRGLGGLISVLTERSDPGQGGTMLYLLTDPRNNVLAGNLARWPDATLGADGWLRFRLDTGRPADPHHPAQATSFLLPGGFQLLVGRDLAERAQFTTLIRNALISAGIVTLFLGLGGGLLLSRRVLSRLEAIRRASDRVMAGRLGERIPLRHAGEPGHDEYDRLAQNLNAMLDRIERLMDGMRQVSDNIAHDLRSPLGRLRSRLELTLREEPDDIADYREAVQAAIEEADQLLATFSALLDIAAAEAGTLSAPMAKVDLCAVLAELAEFLEPVADEQGLRFETTLPATPIVIDGNRHLLTRALANLVENAIKYTPAPGRVSMSLARSETKTEIVIADTGPGIPAEERERVFHRLVRLDQSRSTPGNGLGLSLARAIARLHRGDIILADAEPGLRVSVTLPEPSGEPPRV